MWIALATIAYLINAGVYTADKHFLSNKIHSSISYAFYVGVWSIGNAVLFFLTPFVPTWQWMLLDILAGFLFLWALIAWYKALHQSEATRVVAVVGALIPIFSLLFSFFLLGETFSRDSLLGIFFLIAGGILISIRESKEKLLHKCTRYCRVVWGITIRRKSAEDHPIRRLITNSIVAAIAFASYYVLIKYIYLHQPFLGSYIWTRMGGFIGALLLLVIPANRKIIFERTRKKAAIKSLPLFLSIRFIAVIAFILLNFAISLGSVAVINALQGVQYLFMLVIVLVISEKYPDIIKEEMGRKVLTQKFIGVVLIALGLYVIL